MGQLAFLITAFLLLSFTLETWSRRCYATMEKNDHVMHTEEIVDCPREVAKCVSYVIQDVRITKIILDLVND